MLSNNKLIKVLMLILVFILLFPSSSSFAQVVFSTDEYDYEGFEIPETVGGETLTLNLRTGDNYRYRSIEFKIDDQDNTKLYKYKVSVSQGGKDIPYRIKFPTNECVPLASDSKGIPLTEFDRNKTEVIVPLISNDIEYTIELIDGKYDKNEPVEINIQALSGSDEQPYVSPLSTSIITSKEDIDPEIKMYEWNNFNNRIVYEYNLNEDELAAIEAYKAGTGAKNDLEDGKGSWIEGVLVDIILGFGQMIQWLAEMAFGFGTDANDGLSMDNLIFNRLDQIVIDLRDVFPGGIQVGPSEVRGYFAGRDSMITRAIQSVFSGLRGLAIVIYLIMLLYIGVKILINIGTKEEAKTMKFIQYWVTGVGFLFFIPYFLAAIPTINNTMVKVLSNEAKVASTYSISDIIKELGISFTGEDAEIAVMKDELNKRITEIQKKLDNKDTILTVDEAMEKIDKAIGRYRKNTTDGLNEAETEDFKQQYRAVAEKIYDNAGDWENSNYYKNQFRNDLYNIRDYIYLHHSTIQTFHEPNSTFLTSFVKSNLYVDGMSDSDKEEIKAQAAIIANVLENPACFNRETGNIAVETFGRGTEYSEALDKIREILIRSTSISEASRKTEEFSKKIQDGSYFKNWFNNIYNDINKAFDEYMTAVLKEKLETYQGMLDSLRDDPMVLLERLAKEQVRAVYAVAWLILMFQTFSVLFMYVKRVLITMILICLFPLVMAVYVIDKMGDGKSQSLETWFKEFIANTTVQFFHACIYVLIVNLGIDAVRTNPSKNWFILIIATCCLFPAERILRNILGIRSTTLGQLKISGSAAIGAGIAAFTVGRNMATMGANGVRAAKQGLSNIRADMKTGDHLGTALKKQAKKTATNIGNKVSGHFTNNWDSVVSASEEKKARKQQYRDSRAQNRRDLIARRAGIVNNGGISSWRDVLTTARAGVATVTGAASDLTAKIRNSKPIRGLAMIGGGASKGLRFAGKELKAAGNLYRKGLGLAVGAVAATDALANGGPAAAITAGIATGRTVGGFKNTKSTKKPKPRDNSNNPYNPQYGAISNPVGAGYGGSSYYGSTGGGGVASSTDGGGDGSNDSSGMGMSGAPEATGEETQGANTEIPTITQAAIGGTIVGSAMDTNSGVQEASDSEGEEGGAQPQEVPADNTEQPGKIETSTTVEMSETSDGDIQVTNTSEVVGSGDLSGIDEIDTTSSANVAINEDGEISTSAENEADIKDESGDSFNNNVSIDD